MNVWSYTLFRQETYIIGHMTFLRIKANFEVVVHTKHSSNLEDGCIGASVSDGQSLVQ